MNEGLLQQFLEDIACRKNRMGDGVYKFRNYVVICPDHAHLIIHEAAQLVHVHALESPELQSVRELMDQATKFRRPPERLVREMKRQMRALGRVLGEQAEIERATMN